MNDRETAGKRNGRLRTVLPRMKQPLLQHNTACPHPIARKTPENQRLDFTVLDRRLGAVGFSSLAETEETS